MGISYIFKPLLNGLLLRAENFGAIIKKSIKVISAAYSLFILLFEFISSSMAPRETIKSTPKIQRNVTITKATVTKPKSSPVNTFKKAIATRTVTEKSIGKVNSNAKLIEPKRRTNTVLKLATPKSEENKPTIPVSSVTKSAKKALWKRRPKPAHSGVPCPEKMRKLLEQQLQDCE